ncbi:MAG TPA: phytanoyl-CoA dioxygenase family protein [Actinocrinis sp.]|uniref:phytanoyl-CoA dioxygenase family protein n=1 Tax=Actinocrinis sp. TaxID=1920516 RepID=UPI002D25FBCA|nr:phytanoyl-CoA dioxygenase family protein [Actinocrinis sp.]HZU56288.1 phytanoyl-CoA dioxygenase family protein [Actinocrinis sp.]
MSTTVINGAAMDNDVMAQAAIGSGAFAGGAGPSPSLPYHGIRLSEQQRTQFDRDGYFIVRDAIPAELLVRLDEAMERVYAQEKAAGGLRQDDQSLHLMGFLHRDKTFLELLELPTVFPLVWGILGWNIHAYHHHLDVHPPIPQQRPKVWRWHQDGGRQNLEIETEPVRPLLSIRTSFWLSDASQPGRGNFMCIPGTHKTSRLPRPENPELGFEDPEGAIEVCPNRGDVVIFDRRIYHGRSDNYSQITRRVLFVGWTYRWIAPHEDRVITPEHPWWDELTPIQQQLLGGGRDALSYWGLGEDHFPLREYLAERGLLDPAVNNNR